MIIRIKQTVYSEFGGVHKCEPVWYKIPKDLQKMVDDIHHMSRDSSIEADIVSAELTDSDNQLCNNPYHNNPTCDKEQVQKE